MLLAFSQNEAALPTLRESLSHPDEGTRGDVVAAIDAIESRNHHYFVDREHSNAQHGRMVGLGGAELETES